MKKDKILQFPHQGPDIKEMMLDRGEDAAWIRRTFAQYVQDQTALMQYVLQT